MRILVSNDDGIHAPGLAALVEALQGLGELWVVAPERERSAASHAISLRDPLRAWEVPYPGARAWATTGTPADCVLIGARELLPALPEVVVSGINRGANLGEDVWYSGTVAAAKEGTMWGLPAVALSVCCGFDAPDYRAAAAFARRLLPLAAEHLARDVLLNVNVPNLPPDQIRGAQVCHQGRRRYQTSFDKRTDPRGGVYYWIGTGEPLDEPDPGSDVSAVAAGQIAVTPVRLDLTADDAGGIATWLPSANA
ncbi:MAG: 5'/3'-nucleotidase SurE [Fimbriimonadaceae bacterium]|nr:5'/3'-nucleotidase SurE [Fimbriimonadaceae bacterium]